MRGRLTKDIIKYLDRVEGTIISGSEADLQWQISVPQSAVNEAVEIMAKNNVSSIKVFKE
jgi:hypothetical protein